MKQFLFFFLVLSISINCQSTKTKNLSDLSADSVDVHAMVQKQIILAMEKHTESKIDLLPDSQEKIKVPPDNVSPSYSESKPAFLNFLFSQPLHYQLFTFGSFLILLYIALKRVLTNLRRKSVNTLTSKIEMMKEEKVGGGKLNPKLARIRKTLKEKIEIFKRSEKQMSKTAKQLNVSKGELILAAKLKMMEVENMQGV